MKTFDGFAVLPGSLRSRLEKELLQGETVLWAAQPDDKNFQPHQGKIQLLGGVWLAFITLVAVIAFPFRMQTTGLIPPPFGYYTIFSLLFLPGFYLVMAPVWARIFAARTLYVITSKRAILMGCWLRGDFVKVFEGKLLGRAKVRLRNDGAGDIIFRRFRVRFTEDGYSREEIGFFNLPDVRAVKLLLDSLAAKNPF